MKWASAVSDALSLDQAVQAACEGVCAGLDGDQADLAFVFVSAHHADRFLDVPALIGPRLRVGLLTGCSGGGVIGAGREIENRPGFSITAAVLPGVQAR